MDTRYVDLMKQGLAKMGQKKKVKSKKTQAEKLAELKKIINYPIHIYGEKFAIDMPQGFTNYMTYTEAKNTFKKGDQDHD